MSNMSLSKQFQLAYQINKSRRQRGAGLMSVIFNVGILIFIGFIAVRVGGLYFDNRIVDQSLNSLSEVPHINKKSSREVMSLLRKRLDVNNLDISNKEIMIDKRSDRLLVDIVYERRAPFVSNMSIVVNFENNLELVRN